MKTYDWSQPQRQPVAGLVVTLLNSIGNIFRRYWFLIVLTFLGKKGRLDPVEIFVLAMFCFTLVVTLLNFFYFRFYLEVDKLIIKKGWIGKETQIIPLQKIQTINIEQGLLHQWLRVVKVSIDTAGSGKAEARIEALQLSMAESLREQLLRYQDAKPPAAEDVAPVIPQEKRLVKLDPSDLLKLSISANHIEAFFIMLSFAFGIVDNLKSLDDSLFSRINDLLPRGSFYFILFLTVVVLLFTILVSTVRIVFQFYNYYLSRTENGYRIRSGLTNIKERAVALSKIQFLSWKANWLRIKMGLWLMEYGVAGGEEIKKNLRVQVPVTRPALLKILVSDYLDLPSTEGVEAIRMHHAFISRRILLMGILPAVVLGAALWWLISWYVLLFLLLPFYTGLVSWLSWRKFRLFVFEDMLYLKKGMLGETHTVMLLYKLQSVTVKQSIYQRQHALASMVLHTAGGNIYLNYLELADAQKLADLVLFKTESENKSWM